MEPIPNNETVSESQPIDSVAPVEENVNAKNEGKGKFNISLSKIERRTLSIFRIFTRVIAILLFVVIIFFVKRELSNKSYIIQNLNVPEEFQVAGYNGQVMANRIFNKLEDLIQIERHSNEAGEYVSASQLLDVNMDVVGTSIPIRESIEFIGRTLGISNRKRISGDITLTNDTAIFIIKFGTEKPERYEIPRKGGIEATVKLLEMKACETILKFTSPYTLSRVYLFNDAESCFKLGKYLLNRFEGNSKLEAIGYFAWAGGYVTQHKWVQAEKVIRDGLKKFGNDLNLNASLGTMLLHEGRYDESLAQAKKVISMLNEDTPLDRRLLSYVNIGVVYFFVGKPDSAEYCLYKGLSIDKNYKYLLFNLARVKLLARKDTLAFRDYFDMALNNGIAIEEFKELSSDSKYLAMLAKFQSESSK